MAPVKFENDLKEKLEQRKLEPSKNAWEILHKRLDENDNKKNNKGLWWLGIAASFVGILIVFSVFFNSGENDVIESIIVDIEEQEMPKQNEDIIMPSNQTNQIIVEGSNRENPISASKKNTNKKVSELKTQLQQKQNEFIKSTAKDVVAQAETKAKNDIKENVIKVKSKLSFEDLKIQEVVAQVLALKKKNMFVSDAEVNTLLDQAQKDIMLHNLYNAATKKVDANALLQGVEDDLEQSFRNKAFKAIKDGYHYVKTSVAERNN